MADSVQADGLKTWVAAHDFQPTAGSRIALADDREVGTDVVKHGGVIGGRGLQANLLAERSISSVLR